MKKNLLTIIILALLIVNIVLTSIMMFSVMNTNAKTAELVTNIATALKLELTVPGEEEKEIISLADTQVINLSDEVTAPFKMEGDKQKHMQFNVTLSLNTKHKDYKKYSETMADYEQLIKSTIGDVVSSHTETDYQNNPEGVEAEMLDEVQKLFQSDFIYSVDISDVKIG